MAAPTVKVAGLVGPPSARQSDSTSVEQPVRLGDRLEQIIAQGRAVAAEQTVRGLSYAAFIPPGTGQAPGTSIGTTACFTLALAAGSSARLVIRKIMVGYISGTLGAGVLALLSHFAAAGITAPSGGTAITPTNLASGSSATSIANCRFNNTVPASGLMIRAIASLQASLASTAVAPWQVIDPVDGEVVVNAGQAVSIQGIAAAGTSPLITAGMIWTEEPI